MATLWAKAEGSITGPRRSDGLLGLEHEQARAGKAQNMEQLEQVRKGLGVTMLGRSHAVLRHAKGARPGGLRAQGGGWAGSTVACAMVSLLDASLGRGHPDTQGVCACRDRVQAWHGTLRRGVGLVVMTCCRIRYCMPLDAWRL